MIDLIAEITGLDYNDSLQFILQLISGLIIVFAAVLPYILSVRHQKKERRQQAREELIGALSTIHAQFERNAFRLSEYLGGIDNSTNDEYILVPSPRLINVFTENNVNVLSLRLKSTKLLGRIVHAYEEHNHINRRWDNLINPDLTRSIETERDACNNVLRITEEIISEIDTFIKDLRNNKNC
ncbi:hypothetical protein CEE37_09970 [candidate division LCP-89 bacterium B3_LCP]|uniref:Uncharacterized protein n=1 Tax=candidate division LCP-89 bacterium B3_LCP TaxID=2012998 RepID=A0A532UYK8_UNCL8|nr:MAG: hypothetical protein CEE37_09970 [candidate division LCP-89 bacterium B3_LCP]